VSLIDAVLLDPHRDPREIWIAIRQDRQRGSGTQSDPYNGSSLPNPTVVVDELKKDAIDPKKAIVTTDGPHGFSTGDLVTIGGVDIQLDNVGNGDSSDNFYVGTFAINVTGLNSFTYLMPNPPLNSPAPVPAGGSIQCWRERELFDVVMRNAPENCAIHLGVGEFQTKGRSEIQGAIDGWQPKSGQRFLGSSMGLTTIKLVHAAGVGWRKYYAIFATNVNGFEVADLTVDCNVDGQLSPFTNCAAIAVNSVAHHIRIRRVRVINFGSNGPVGPTDPAYSENFPFFVGGTDVMDVVYEDCVAEQPAPDVVWNSTVLQAGGGFVDSKTFYARGLMLRNNYVNGQIVYGPRTYVESVEVTGNLVTLTTKTPHGHKMPGNVSVQGLKVDSNTNNRFNGVFKIEQIVSDTVLEYTAFANNLEIGEVDGDPIVDAATIVGAPVAAHQVLIGTVSVTGDNKTFTVKTITPYAPHNLTVNNRMWIGGITVNEVKPYKPGNTANGLFRVTNVTSKTQFDYVADEELTVPPNPSPPFYNFTGEIAIGLGLTSNAFTSADGGTGAVVEGNRLLHGTLGGPWHDTASTLDLVARNNYYHDIDVGALQHIQPFFGPSKPAAALTHSGRVATLVLGTGQEHGLVPGQVIFIENAAIGGNPANPFNGYFTVKSINAASFTYKMSAEPAADADPSPPPTYRPVAQVANWNIENNVIELAVGRLQGYWSNPSGIQLTINPDYFADIPYAFRQVLVRENIIRQIDGQKDTSHFGIIVRGSEKLQAENNVIDVGGASLRFNKSVTPSFFNNRNSTGTLQLGYDEVTGQNQGDLPATKVEDALIVSI
jgi:uncharacterized protein YunC (DUF1805 family)